MAALRNLQFFSFQLPPVLYLFLFALTGSFAPVVLSQDSGKSFYKPQKNISLTGPFKQRKTEDFVKRLEYEYASGNVNENSLDFGLVPIDLNLLPDDLFAEEVADEVDEQISNLDADYTTNDRTAALKTGNVSMMHQGTYLPSPKYSALVDGILLNLKKDMETREMDPLYFSVQARGSVSHRRTSLKDGNRTNETSLITSSGNNNTYGGGVLTGLLKVNRFGYAESRVTGNVTLIRSHFFFGPLNIDLIFDTKRGLRIVNSTLSAWAAHGLLEASEDQQSRTLLEFKTDSPMEYEIQYGGTKNQRLQNLARTAVTRLFRRGARMQVRLERSLRRAVAAPVINLTKDNRRTGPILKHNK